MAPALLICMAACSGSGSNDASSNIYEELEQVLRKDVVELWYPRAIDTLHGGYLSDFDFQWRQDGPQNKMIVSQARHVWTCSKLAELYPEGPYIDYASHGVKFLKETMWDQEFGGFHSLVRRNGQLIDNAQWGGQKTAYGNSFGIYGLAAYVMTTGDTETLEFAKKAFRWLETHSHDPDFGGYFQFISPEGIPSRTGHEEVPAKDQNSSIHLLEAFTELYQVWPNDTLRDRLEELLFLVRDVITTDRGYMNLFFYQDWRPVVFKDSTQAIREANYSLDHVSFGHDVETAYLMMEASEVLGIKDEHETYRRGKQMVDHALNNGWDNEVGGFYDRGYYLPDVEGMTIINHSKVWWTQVEALNTLLIMSQLNPNDSNDYYGKFTLQWSYIKSYLLDPVYGGVYVEGIDNDPESKTSDKGGIWKVNYHTARSLMNCMEKIQKKD